MGCCEAGGQDVKMLSQKQRINAPELARPLLPTRTDGLCPGWGREAGTKLQSISRLHTSGSCPEGTAS